MAAVDRYAEDLADGIDATIATWVVRCVVTMATAWAGSADPDTLAAAEAAGQRARSEVGGAIRELLATDVDQQRTTPLALLRGAVRYPTEVLAAAGVPPVERERFAEEAFPRDVYDLSPATFADVDPSLADAGFAWGASKALEHRRRHGPR